MSEYTVVPIMVLGFVRTEGSLVSVDVENNGIDGLEVEFQPLLKRVVNAFKANFCQVLTHFENVEILINVAT